MIKVVFKWVQFWSFMLAALIPQAVMAGEAVPIKILTDPDVIAEHYPPDFSYAGYNHGMGIYRL